MAGSSPPKDQDIFGKELGLTSAERGVVGKGEVFLRKVLQVDTFSKKGDPTEPKILIITNSRCYILSQRPAVKLETTFNFLKIQLLECTETKLRFQLPGEKLRDFHSSRRDSVEVIGLITAQLKNVFPITPLEMILKLSYDPDALRAEVTSLRDSLLSSMDRGDASSLQGFITSYAFLCDFFGVAFSDEVVWYLKNVYLAHGFRDLNLSDFNHLSTRDLLPVLSTLRHNEFFEGVIVNNDRLASELVEELCYVINVSRALKKLVLHNASIRSENLIRLSVALKNNPRSALIHLDLSDNIFDDKSIESLGNALENLPHGLHHLVLANCKITNRAGSMLAQSLKQNKHMQFSLVHCDLSGNPLGPDPLGALTFIQEPQTISYLDLSGCGLTLDSVLQVLIRGCQQHLSTLNLSHNSGKGKKGVLSANVAAKLQQFFSSCIAITSINFTDCRLTSEIVSAILEGLSVNPNITSVDLNISSNDLGCGADPGAMAKVISRTDCLHKLDISECGIDQCLPVFVGAISANTKLKHVAIGKNFNGKPPVRVSAMDKLCALLRKEDCHLKSLSVQDSKLKELAFSLLVAVSDNASLLKLNISGNVMGNHGARYLAKVLLTNCHLREVSWDHNDTTQCGLLDVVSALKHNYTLRVMPLPLADIGKAGKETEGIVQQIQQLLCRNHSDERLKVELAARHRGRLLTATQQSSVVSRELVQLEDLLKWAESVHGTSHNDVQEALTVKNEANKVLKLTDGLYSPQVESEQFQAISTQVKSLFESFMDKIYTEHIKDTSDRMVEQTLKACPSLLTEEAKGTVRNMVLSSSVSSDFTYAKKAVTKKAAPEIVNHVSAINLDVAANISELIVEQTLVKLDKANLRLTKLHKAARSSSATPDTKVSRNFTFRVEQSTPPKKKRARRPDRDEQEEEQVDLPTQPLESEGPALQHLGKTRPKPARMQRGRSRQTIIKPSPVPDEPPAEETEQPKEKKEQPTEPKVAMVPPKAQKAELESKEPLVNKSEEESKPTEVAEEKEETKELERSQSSEPSPLESSGTPKASPRPSPRPRVVKTEPEKKEASEEPAVPVQPATPDLPNTEPVVKEKPEEPKAEPEPEPEQEVKEDDKPQSTTPGAEEQASDEVKSPVAKEESPSPTEPRSEISAPSDDKSVTPTPPPTEESQNKPTPPLEERSVTPSPDTSSSPPAKEEQPPTTNKDVPAASEKPESPPVDMKPDTPPVSDTASEPAKGSSSLSTSEDDQKEVVQPPPEPKIILPAPPKTEPTPPNKPELAPPKSPSPEDPPHRTPSPKLTPEDRRGSGDGKRTKDRKRATLSKLFGKKPKNEPTPEVEKAPETTSQQVGEWEVLENKQPSVEPPPPVKEKPAPAVREKPAVKPKQRPQTPAEQEQAPPPETAPKRMPIGVQMPNVNMVELASALKKKPKVPPPKAEKPSSNSPKPERRSTIDPGPPAPKPRPKPRGPKKTTDSPGEDRQNEPASSEPSTDNLDTLV